MGLCWQTKSTLQNYTRYERKFILSQFPADKCTINEQHFIHWMEIYLLECLALDNILTFHTGFLFEPPPPSPSGNFNFAPYSSLKTFVLATPTPLMISMNPLCGDRVGEGGWYVHFLEKEFHLWTNSSDCHCNGAGASLGRVK